MSIRTILTPFSGDSDIPAMKMALAVAGDFGAHVAGLHVEAEQRFATPAVPAPELAHMGAGAFGMSAARHIAAADPYAEATRARDAAAAASKAHFEQLCREHGVTLLEARDSGKAAEHPLPSASYHRETGTLEHAIGQHAHRYDLVVAESASVSKAGKAVQGAIETALLKAGRPVLLAPMQPPEHLDGRVMVAWNDSPQCWHALFIALPFLSRASEVVLFNAGSDRRERAAEEKAAEYLAWHGIEAKLAQHEPVTGDVAGYLMSECGERQVGLMVMGAYSHSPLREKLLGGVTLSMLSNSAATPVLMMH
jgi:nucleotide-binding universal stress UspA family protein